MAETLYLIYGDDEYLVSTKAGEIVNSLVPPEQKDLGLDVVDGDVDTVAEAVDAVNACLASMQSMGLFSADKVVWLKNVSFLYDNRVGRSESVKNRLAQLADRIKHGLPGGITLVISAQKVDKRKAFFKACKAAGEVHEFQMPDKAYQANKVAAKNLESILADAGLKMSKPVKELFLAKVGNDTRHLVGEVEKLAVYLGGPGAVEKANVQAIVSSAREAIAWDLADAFGNRNLPGALSILRQLVFQKENIIGIIIGLENRIRDLLLYREAYERGWVKPKGDYGVLWLEPGPEGDRIFSEYMGSDPRKTHPFRAANLLKQACKFSRKRLIYCLHEVTKGHAALVSSRVPQEMTLELLLVRMLAVGGKRTRNAGR